MHIVTIKSENHMYWMKAIDFDYDLDWDEDQVKIIDLENLKIIGQSYGIYFPNDDVWLVEGKEGQPGSVILHHHDHGKSIYVVDRWNPEAQHLHEHEITPLKQKIPNYEL